MRIPDETIQVERFEDGFAANTSLVAGPVGRGQTEREAVANLRWAVRAHLKMALAAGQPLPDAFRVPASRRVVLIAAFIALVVVLPVVAAHVWHWLSR